MVGKRPVRPQICVHILQIVEFLRIANSGRSISAERSNSGAGRV